MCTDISNTSFVDNELQPQEVYVPDAPIVIHLIVALSKLMPKIILKTCVC